MLTFDLHDFQDYEALNGQDPFKSIAIPRPIGWISTISKDGISNLAAFSQFTNVNFDEPHILFSAQLRPDGTRKDTVINAEETRCFVHNFVPYSLMEQMNLTAPSYPPEIDEFEKAGLTKANSIYIPAKRVAESPIQMEVNWIS